MAEEAIAYASYLSAYLSVINNKHSQIVTSIEVIIGNCFPEVGKILPEAKH